MYIRTYLYTYVEHITLCNSHNLRIGQVSFDACLQKVVSKGLTERFPQARVSYRGNMVIVVQPGKHSREVVLLGWALAVKQVDGVVYAPLCLALEDIL